MSIGAWDLQEQQGGMRRKGPLLVGRKRFGKLGTGGKGVVSVRGMG